jgi:hypothetical protein
MRGRPIPRELVGRPFTVVQAQAAGVSHGQLRTQRFRQVVRGVYVGADVPNSFELMVEAVGLVLPSVAAFSHYTAARLLRMPLPRVAESIHVTVPPELAAPRIAGVVAHRARLDHDVGLDHDVVRLRGHRLTSPARTFVDLAAVLPALDLVALGDGMLRRGLASAETVTACANAAKGRGCAAARWAAALVAPGVDSPMETRVRLLLVLGDVHRTDRNQWQDDIQQTRLLRDLGWEVLELTARDVMQRPARTVAMVHEQLVRRGHPEVPAQPSDEWRRFWPDLGSIGRSSVQKTIAKRE